MSNGFCHIELSADAVGPAKKFYKGLFDWKLNDIKMPGMDYTMIDAGKGKVGGGMMKKMPGAPASWLPYVEVADVKKTLTKAAKLGAKIVMNYQEMGGNGAVGIFLDPAGAPLGIWAPSPKKAVKKPAKKK
jgi:uncharacterized protein